MNRLLDFIESLESKGIHYNLACNTPRQIMVSFVVPGERWEVEFSEDSEPEFEIFSSNNGVQVGAMAEFQARFPD